MNMQESHEKKLGVCLSNDFYWFRFVT